jgi:4-hydroxybenzoate polyprenyltransferase
MIRKTSAGVPLCVDMDGTLLKVDTTWELLIAVLKRRPWLGVVLPFWLTRGKAYTKRRLFPLASLDITHLPVHAVFLAYLQAEQAAGRPLYLVTASDKLIATKVAQRFGIFTDVIGSEGIKNIGGKGKATALVERFGDKQFDYAGNSRTDLAVWPHARQALVVGASSAVAAAVDQLAPIERVFEPQPSQVAALLRTLRLHQWVKNSLVFVPLIAAHRLYNLHLVGYGLLAFITFSLCASSLYILNDLLDTAADRRHPRKRQRPLAAGDLSVPVAVLAIPVLLVISFSLGWHLPGQFWLFLGTYMIGSALYSLILKQVAWLDVVFLAGLYTLRVIAGGRATETPVSDYLLLLSIFLFMSLALLKRFTELQRTDRSGSSKVARRGYTSAQARVVFGFGVASGLMAGGVLLLYVALSPQAHTLYEQPLFLWLTIPLVLGWILYLWRMAQRGQMHDDPILFSLRDRVSYIIGGILVLLLVVA